MGDRCTIALDPTTDFSHNPIHEQFRPVNDKLIIKHILAKLHHIISVKKMAEQEGRFPTFFSAQGTVTQGKNEHGNILFVMVTKAK